VLDKPKQSVPVASQGKPGGGKAAAAAAAAAANQQASSKARVVRTETSVDVLNDLVARWRAFKDDVQQVRQGSAGLSDQYCSPRCTEKCTGCGKKSSPLKFFAVFSATTWNFNMKFYRFIYRNVLHLTVK